MKINNKNIIGLNIYSPDHVYERKDMVIKGSTIYICDPKNSDHITGEDPENNPNFKVYLGDQSSNIEEYFHFLETGEGGNKYISINTLQSVLNHFMIGIDSKGVIGDHIDYLEDGSYHIVLKNEELGESYSDLYNILSTIMMDPEINNAIFRVSRNLPELLPYSLGIEDCILKQYTTKNDSGIFTRIQELIDPSSGLIYFRYTQGDGSVKYDSPGVFKCSIVKTDSIKAQIDRVLSVYANRLQYMQDLENSLKSNYRYKAIQPDSIRGQNIVTLTRTNKTLPTYIGGTDLLTLLVQKNVDGLIDCYQTTISLLEKHPIPGENKYKYPTYSIFKDGTLDIEETIEGEIILTLSNGLIFTDITLRDYYGN